MAIKITISNRVKFWIEGTNKDEDGKDLPFKYGLLARRLDTEQHRDRTKSADIDFVEYMADVVEDWFDVRDADNKEIAFSPDNLRALLRQPGQAALAYFTYLRETGAKAKN